MFNFNVLLATVLVTAAVVVADGPTIGTPASLTQCQPVLLSWQNAQGEAYISVLPGKQISAAPLVSFAPQPSSVDSIKWVPNLPAGTEVTFAVSDSTGVKNYSGTVSILAGQDTSCLSSSGSAAANGSSATTGSSSGSGSGSVSGSSGSSGSSSSSAPASSSTGSSSSSNSANTSSSSGSTSAQNQSTQKSGASSFKPNTAAMASAGLAAAAVAAAIFA